MSTRTWRLLVLSAIAVGLAVRLGSVLGRSNLPPGGDPQQYWLIARLVVDGQGWIDPVLDAGRHQIAQTAKLPPLYTMLLTLCPLLGFKSFFATRIFSALLNTAAVPIGAALGRDVAGRTAGVLTAFGLALYPNIWMPASLSMSETISPILALLVLWAGYRLFRRPSVRAAALTGLAIGFAGLARDEMLVFALLILLPVCLRRGGGRSWRERWTQGGRMLAAGAIAIAAVVAPWAAFNTVRFHHPVLITTRLGVTLGSANCDSSWYGPAEGYWSMACAIAELADKPGSEVSQQGPATQAALDYISAHLGDLPRVELDRLGRTFDFWNVGNQMTLDHVIENRPQPWVSVGLWCWYGLVLLAPYGAWRLRRAGVPLFPLVAVLIDVVLVTLLTYGDTRFRATLEPAMVLLGAVAVAGLLRRPVPPFEDSAPEKES